MKVKCQFCGTIFNRSPSNMKGGVVYCSKTCRGASNPKVEKKCVICATPFFVIPSLAKKFSTCSLECRTKRKSRSKSAFWKGRKEKTATCHPERRHIAKGLCKSCYDGEYYSKNDSACKERSKQWAKINPSKVRATNRKYLYGIDTERISHMLENQNTRCGICARELGSFDVDHDHTTGKVRGLLCGMCNRGLGCFDDSIEALKNAIIYLTKPH